MKYIAHNGNKSVINFKIVNDKEDGGKNIKNILNAEGIHNYQELKTSNIMSSPRGEAIIKRFLKYDWFDDFVEGSEQYFREQSRIIIALMLGHNDTVATIPTYKLVGVIEQ